MPNNIKEVIFSITSRCNLRCRMCDIPSVGIEELTTEDWKTVIKDASRLGAQTVVFSGGEPLLRDDIFELIEFSRKNNLNACVTSNGQMINDQVAGRLYSSGVNVVNISIEGSMETHDSLRGPGSFEKATAGLANLKKNNIESTVAATVSRCNYKDLLRVLEIARDYGATTVRLQPFNAIFLKDQRRKKEFLIGRKDVPCVEEIIKKFIIISREYKIAVNPAGYLLRIPAYLSGQNFYPKSCAALWYSCPINPNGDLFPCWIEGSNKKLIGNVKKEGLYNLWFSEKRLKTIGSIVKNGCRGCLMSCYDEAFDRKMFKEAVIHNAKKIKKITNFRKVADKILQSLKGQGTRMKLRYKFYISYRGSFRGILVRRLRRVFSRPEAQTQGRAAPKDLVLAEIEKAKNKIRKEMRAL